MLASILIVSKDRRSELKKTLEVLEEYSVQENSEVLVFLDGCTDSSESLIREFPRVKWEVSSITYSASKARNFLFRKAKGDFLVGFDDDSCPINQDFLKIIEEIFNEDARIGVISFEEVRSPFSQLAHLKKKFPMEKNVWVNQFVGCGFAIRRELYFKTGGFPPWIDIYGEEACLSLEVLELNYKILFTNRVRVLHRKDVLSRKESGGDVFRFEKQLKNSAAFYIVYYPFPVVFWKIFWLYIHNFRRYGIRNRSYFLSFVKAMGENIADIFFLLRWRRPASEETLKKFKALDSPKF